MKIDVVQVDGGSASKIAKLPHGFPSANDDVGKISEAGLKELSIVESDDVEGLETPAADTNKNSGFHSTLH